MAEVKRTEPLSDSERLILNNVFDTQPAKRQAYLKQLGFQMNPDNDDQYKPIGSDQPWGKIALGAGDYLKEFQKGGLSAVGSQYVAQHGMNLARDATMLALSVRGAGMGAAVGGPAAEITGPMGFFLGGAGGYYGSEELKNAFANHILEDKDIPADHWAMGIHAALASGANTMLAGAAHLVGKGMSSYFDMQANAIKNGLENGATQGVLKHIADNPQIYQDGGYKNGMSQLTDLNEKIFGTEDPLTIKRPEDIKTGLFRDKLSPLNDAANDQISKLGKNPDASFTAADVQNKIQGMIRQISGGKDNFQLQNEAKEAVTYLQNKLDEFNQGVIPKVTQSPILDAQGQPVLPTQADPSEIKVPFNKVYDLAKSIQGDAFDREVPGSNFLKQFTGGDPNGLTAVLDQKAASVGSNLPQINAQRSQIFNAYQAAKQTLTPTNLQNAFLTDEPNSIAKETVQRAVDGVDGVLGTNLKQQIQDGSAKAWIQGKFANAGEPPNAAQTVVDTVKHIPTAVGEALGLSWEDVAKSDPQAALEKYLDLQNKTPVDDLATQMQQAAPIQTAIAGATPGPDSGPPAVAPSPTPEDNGGWVPYQQKVTPTDTDNGGWVPYQPKSQ
jgi:hypothetical protein